MTVDPRRMRAKISTQPEDWAPPVRAHLFGLHTLAPVERAYELERFSGGRPKYGDAALLEAARLRQQMRA